MEKKKEKKLTKDIILMHYPPRKENQINEVVPDLHFFPLA
jgi:hypothetical protein